MRKSLSVAVLTSLLALSALAADAPVPVVNVNSATVAQLAFLPGVGPKVAEAIVAARPYTSVEDVTRAKGIGDKKLAKMRPYVTLTGETTATAKIRPAK